ncbi:RecT family recombinase [Hyphomicrobium sp.]|uniref:RecT family recombinase n=1 Tax=Hyphomicrobium sp. TaxID=82 RepID=UPI001DC5E3F4|nr:RecT family recombinase [Hyphomicrobium sp.]MBY0561452.1 recombinase RecT [Hyphomicrobium sp.]
MSRYSTALALREDVRGHEDSFKELMPKGYRLDRFLSSLDVWVASHPELLRCDPVSVVAECQKAVNDGMIFDGRRAILVPFFERKTKQYLAQYMPMYQGILERLKDLGDVTGIDCQAVYQADFFEVYTRDNKLIVDWRPNTEVEDRGLVRAAYVHFKGLNDQIIHTAVMLRNDIEDVRRKSQNPNGEAWRDWYGEMAKKSVIHRGAKMVPLSDEGRRIITREDAFAPVLEGQNLLGPRAAGDNPLKDHSLDDFDENGDPLNPPAEEPMPPPRNAKTIDAEVIAMPSRPAEPDVSLDFGVTDEEDGPSTISIFELFARGLEQAETLADAKRLAHELKADMDAIGTREEKLRANEQWQAAVQRLSSPSKTAKKSTSTQRRRA